MRQAFPVNPPPPNSDQPALRSKCWRRIFVKLKFGRMPRKNDILSREIPLREFIQKRVQRAEDFSIKEIYWSFSQIILAFCKTSPAANNLSVLIRFPVEKAKGPSKSVPWPNVMLLDFYPDSIDTGNCYQDEVYQVGRLSAIHIWANHFFRARQNSSKASNSNRQASKISLDFGAGKDSFMGWPKSEDGNGWIETAKARADLPSMTIR